MYIWAVYRRNKKGFERNRPAFQRRGRALTFVWWNANIEKSLPGLSWWRAEKCSGAKSRVRRNSTYIATKSKAAALSTTIKKAESHRVNIPERLRPKADEIVEYGARIQRELQTADTLLQKIERKVGWNKEGTKQTPLSGPFSAKQCYIWCKLIFELCGGSTDEMRQNVQ